MQQLEPNCPRPDSCAPADKLAVRVEQLEIGLAGVIATQSTLVSQMSEVSEVLRRQDEQIGENAAMLRSIASDMRENTELTKGIRDAVITARTAGKAARWLAPTLVACAAVVASVKGWAIDITGWLKR